MDGGTEGERNPMSLKAKTSKLKDIAIAVAKKKGNKEADWNCDCEDSDEDDDFMAVKCSATVTSKQKKKATEFEEIASLVDTMKHISPFTPVNAGKLEDKSLKAESATVEEDSRDDDMDIPLGSMSESGELDKDMILSSQDSKTDMSFPNIVRIESACTTSSDVTSNTNWSRANSSNKVPLLRKRDSSYGVNVFDSFVKFSQDVLVVEFEKNKSSASLAPLFLSGRKAKRSNCSKHNFMPNNQVDRSGMKIVDIGHYHEWCKNDRLEKNSEWRFLSEDDDKHLKMNNINGSVEGKSHENVNKKSEDSNNIKSSSVEHSLKTAPAMFGQNANIFQGILDDFVLDLKIANVT
mmetsp:Transcript_59674/g.69740  ORF Transcript_59674/g.69740 Transcript_59674/m.69740 type:complete len:350 (-) Transcript_59674:133-1182(-)